MPQQPTSKQGDIEGHAAVVGALRDKARPDKAEFFPRFFKVKPGDYGEGDRFLGVTVPEQRAIAKQFRELPLEQLAKLLQSEWHEERLTALLILVLRFERAQEPHRREIVNFYLQHLDRVNNWDLVDTSAPKILGVYALEMPVYRKRIDELAASGQLWCERVAVLATFPQIKRGDFAMIMTLAGKFLGHKHDLIHKAVGWMLREMGKIDRAPLIAFLDSNGSRMPRTMLRYAIEKLPPHQREFYLDQ